MRRTIPPVLLLLAFAAFAAAEPRAPAPSDDARFLFLKQLEGTWVGTPGNEGDGAPGTIEFRVTAGGHTVEEREFAGTPMEMVTLYAMEGSDLVARHHCVLGNQPRLQAARQVTDGSLFFACDGKPGNTASHAEEHVHAWTIRLDGEGKLHYSAELVKQGKSTEAPSWVLTRASNTASR